MIDFTKPVRTKGGKPVTILTTERRHPGYPVLGYIGDSYTYSTWDLEGKDAFTPSEDALENVPEGPEPREYWYNYYYWPNGDMDSDGPYSSHPSAVRAVIAFGGPRPDCRGKPEFICRRKVLVTKGEFDE